MLLEFNEESRSSIAVARAAQAADRAIHLALREAQAASRAREDLPASSQAALAPSIRPVPASLGQAQVAQAVPVLVPALVLVLALAHLVRAASALQVVHRHRVKPRVRSGLPALLGAAAASSNTPRPKKAR
jgi:hypothetical protein